MHDHSHLEPTAQTPRVPATEENPSSVATDAFAPIRLSTFMVSVPPEPPVKRIDLRKRARQSRNLYLAIVASFWISIGLTFGVLCPLTASPHSPQMQGWLDRLSIAVMVGFMGALMIRGWVQQCWKQDLWNLLDAEDPHTMSLLIDLLDSSDDALYRAAHEKLPRLLRRLQASDALLLTAKQRDRLQLALMGNHKALVLAILKAFEQVGDQAALPTVQKLAAGEWQAAQDSAVRAAAAECLPFLVQRIQQAGMSRTLLRPSDSLSLPDETLLHPAGASADTAPDELLRPTAEENS
jgi:hypothetical protein